MRRILVTVNDAVSRIVMAVGILLVGAIVVLTLTEVVARFLSSSILWAQEVTLLLLIWSVFLAATICFRSKSHLVIDLIPVKRESVLGRIKEALVAVACLAFAVAFIAYGWQLVTQGASRGTPVLGIPLAVGWAAPMVCGLMSVPFVLESWLAPGNVDVRFLPEGADK